MRIHKLLKLKILFQHLLTKATAFVMVLSTVLFAICGSASAAQITSRKLTLSSSVASAATTYTFSFVLPTSTTILSAEAVICTTASGACSTPAGFTVTGATLSSQPTNMGSASGWTVNTATAGSLRMVNASNSGSPTGTSTMTFGNVTNPSTSNATFYARINTYSGSGWTGALDSGTVAVATAGQITVTAGVDETLTFTLTTATVALGTLSTGSPSSGTSTMVSSTNGATGYVITVNGTTLTSGANTVPALASQTASSAGTSQFGINLVSNTTPTVGANVSGAGSGTANANYGTTNQYRFVTGDTVASAAGPTNSNTFTVSYIANISSVQKPGAYSTVLTYIDTATF